jgi:ubiquinone/menaquinone biosynthesis C-methylase UbiE
MQKFYSPFTEIIAYCENQCRTRNAKKILEIGPGNIKFKPATHTIDWIEQSETNLNINLNETAVLPYADKEFDYVYCRHVLEDLTNPCFIFKEIIRISKAGWIETPSPLIEQTYEVDLWDYTLNYKGYVHHKSLCWTTTSIEGDVIFNVLDKFPIIDQINEIRNDDIKHGVYWNSYFEWDESSKVQFKHHYHDQEWSFFGGRNIILC